jgi:hypothetical protein
MYCPGVQSVHVAHDVEFVEVEYDPLVHDAHWRSVVTVPFAATNSPGAQLAQDVQDVAFAESEYVPPPHVAHA